MAKSFVLYSLDLNPPAKASLLEGEACHALTEEGRVDCVASSAMGDSPILFMPLLSFWLCVCLCVAVHIVPSEEL